MLYLFNHTAGIYTCSAGYFEHIDKIPKTPAMPRVSSKSFWLPKLITRFNEAGKSVFSYTDLWKLIESVRLDIGIPISISASKVTAVLLAETDLREVTVTREGRRTEAGGKRRYTWRNASPYALGLSLAKSGYLSHASAVFIHALSDQVPKTIYINKEQSPKPWARGTLTQPAIDRAFRNAHRSSKFAFTTGNNRFVLLSGKNTGRLEVSSVRFNTTELLDVTKLERTLIDIVVRPSYAGGIHEVAAAFAAAKDRVSVGTLIATLKKLDYVYPYHQSIGFFMERAKYGEDVLHRIEALGIRWNFYLDYRMTAPVFNDRWRLFVPEGF